MLLTIFSMFMVDPDISEKRIRIAVIDSGLNERYFTEKVICKDGHYDFTGTGLHDDLGHGTNVAGLIAKYLNPNKQCITILKVFSKNGNDNNFFREMNTSAWLIQSVLKAIKLKVNYINMSFGGNTQLLPEKMMINLALRRDIRVLVAMGNEGKDFNKVNCDYYPACYDFGEYPNWFTVANRYNSGQYHPMSNRNGPEKYSYTGVDQSAWGVIMTGTSQATANMTGWLVKKEDMK